MKIYLRFCRIETKNKLYCGTLIMCNFVKLTAACVRYIKLKNIFCKSFSRHTSKEVERRVSNLRVHPLFDMEELPKSNYLKFKPNHINTIRRLYNLDKPGRMKEAIDLLSDWVKKQDHFRKKDFSREYLEILLITTKGSVERAKVCLDKLCTFRTVWPEFFGTADISYFRNSFHMFNSLILPEPTEDLGRVNLFKISGNQTLTPDLITEYIKYSIIFCEYIKKYDYPSGFIILLDYRDVNLMNILSILSPTRLSQMMSLYMDGFGMRIQGIHLVTTSKMADALVSLLKQVLSKKVGNRLHVHKSVDTLYEFIPKRILPSEYGGNAKSSDEIRDDFIRELSTPEHIEYMKEINSASLNESKRPTDMFKESYIGMPGTFRTLSVD